MGRRGRSIDKPRPFTNIWEEAPPSMLIATQAPRSCIRAANSVPSIPPRNLTSTISHHEDEGLPIFRQPHRRARMPGMHVGSIPEAGLVISRIATDRFPIDNQRRESAQQETDGFPSRTQSPPPGWVKMKGNSITPNNGKTSSSACTSLDLHPR